MDKTTTMLKTNSKIEKKLEESKISMEKEEKTKNYTHILRISHDQQESREGTSQRILFS